MDRMEFNTRKALASEIPPEGTTETMALTYTALVRNDAQPLSTSMKSVRDSETELNTSKSELKSQSYFEKLNVNANENEATTQKTLFQWANGFENSKSLNLKK